MRTKDVRRSKAPQFCKYQKICREDIAMCFQCKNNRDAKRSYYEPIDETETNSPTFLKTIKQRRWNKG